MSQTVSKLTPKKWNEMWKVGHPQVISRLKKQAKQSRTAMPAKSYTEALSMLYVLMTFPGATKSTGYSERVNECLTPLTIDLYHLLFELAKKGDDPNADVDIILDELSRGEAGKIGGLDY